MGQNVVLQHEVVGDGERDDLQFLGIGLHCGVQQPCFRRFQLAGVAPPAFDVEEQIVALQQLRDVSLERDEVGRVFRVAPDRDRASDVTVNEAERTAEEVDPGSDDRRPDAVVVEHQRFDQVIEVALVIRDIYRPTVQRGGTRDLDALFTALDLAQDRIERMLECAVDRIALRGAELVQIRVNALPGLQLGLAMPGPQILRNVFTREHCLSDLVKHDGGRL